MSILSQIQNLVEENEQEIKQVNISKTMLPQYYRNYHKYQGSINPKIVENLKKQFEQDPNTCLINDLQIVNNNSDDSFDSNDSPEILDINQHTIKMRFLMDRYKIKEESLLSDALVKESVNSFVYNMNKRTIISKQFQEQSESYRYERDALCNWSQFNLIKLNNNQLKKDKDYNFHKIGKRYEKGEQSNDESIFFNSTANNTINSAKETEDILQERKKNNLKAWQKEINLLNHSGINDLYKKVSAKEEKQKEFLEKFRLNKTFDFGIGQRMRNKQNNQLHKQNIQERYQDEIFPKLPSDIDTIHKHLVEYIDLTGEGNLQPQNLVELKGDIYSALGMTDTSTKHHMHVEQTKALHQDYIETFSTVIENNQTKDISLMTFQREISPISRQVIKQTDNIKLENQEEVELIKHNENEINLNDLKDEDLFNIISGRIDKDALNRIVDKHEQFQNINKTIKIIATTQATDDSKEQVEEVLNQVRAKYIKKGTEDKDTQACFFNKDDHKFMIKKEKKDPDSDNQSVSSYLTKSQISQDKGTKTPTTTSNRVSFIGQPMSRKSFSQNPLKRGETPKKSAIQVFAPRNSINRISISNLSPSVKMLEGRKNSNSISTFQQQYLQAFNRKGSQAQKFEKDELVSAYSFDSEIKEQQEEVDEELQKKKEYLSMIEELDSIETEHNQLLKAILSAQFFPQIHSIYKEVKDLRILRKHILNSKDINEAVQLTKGLNQQICSKLKEILEIIFEGESNFEKGLATILQNSSKINQKNNTTEQAKLKIIFSLLQQFRISLEENKFDLVSIQKQQDPEYQILKIQEALDKHQNKKKMTTSEKMKEEKANYDYSQLSFYNFRKKKENSPKEAKNDDLNTSQTLKDSSSSISLASSTITTKTLTKEAGSLRMSRIASKPIIKESNSSKQMDVSFSLEKAKKEITSPKIKIRLEPVSSQASLNTAANTHKSSSTTGKTFSLNKSPSNLSQILSLSPLVHIQDSPFLGSHLEQIPELDLNNKSTLSLSNKQPIKQANNKSQSNLWNQAKMNVLSSINNNKQPLNSENKKNVSFTWQNQIKLLKQQKEKEEQLQQQKAQNQVEGKLKQIKNVINNYEQVIQSGYSSARSKSINRNSSREQLKNQSPVQPIQLTACKSNSSLKQSVINTAESKIFSPVNKQPVNQLSNKKTPLRNNNSSSNQIQSDSKLYNTSSNIFEYMSKENGKSYMEKSRKDLYTRTEKSADKVQKIFNQIITKTQEFMV